MTLTITLPTNENVLSHPRRQIAHQDGITRRNMKLFSQMDIEPGRKIGSERIKSIMKKRANIGNNLQDGKSWPKYEKG